MNKKVLRISEEMWIHIHYIEDEWDAHFDGNTYEDAKKFIELWKPDMKAIRGDDWGE